MNSSPLVERAGGLVTAVEHEHRVTPRELFFDLVFVFAFTQVATLFAADATFAGIGRGTLVLAALWWTWSAYAWLTNTLDPEEEAVGAALLVALIAMFVAALAVPGVFADEGVLFGAAFLVVWAMHNALYLLAGRGSRDLLDAVLRLAPWTLFGAILILIAGFTDGARTWLWLAALLCAYVGGAVSGAEGWRVHPSHFAERFGLVVIIALGEAFISIGIGANGIDLGLGEVVAAILGLLVATSFWLAYFDFFSLRGEQMLRDHEGPQRVAFARDVYAYAHLPLVVGIVLFAFAMKSIVPHVGDELDSVAAFALCGGCALYLLTFSAIRTRVERRLHLSRGRFLAALALALLLPVATIVPALAALALVTAVWLALHAYELVWWREARAESRSLLAG
ncbi:MAG TPA: low temperature requirement protein A [Gaiellaceae bacterium]|nr:low temperature requirement protein A [Gaiellaceae bacterium]